VSSLASPAAGVLIVRAWVEPHNGSLRARITSTVDVGSPDEEVTTATDIDEIAAIVRSWLVRYLDLAQRL
jgi:hypothetical protein